ncbi:hypothetical protein BBK82_20885 [Lentzea guizhouensis]|uniref:DUF3558 domain-containing protein n=1 Tax=Lentzea guizhouensis TaxID=1586287 RepID=A0A1B2HKB2_9PSEU|nr:DUF3558 family protein [Lentzea guizhouensis]ANZ38151.1 hypothetical protein BBK82_20885 [Lentzea guizhouensis]
MRRLVLLLAVLLLASGCAGKTIEGSPKAQDAIDAASPFDQEAPSSEDPSPEDPTSEDPSAEDPEDPDTAPIDGEVQGVCAVLKWTDLPYPGAKPETPPTQINYDSTFDQSCRWTTKVDNVEVGVSLRFREGRQITIERTTGEYDVNGQKVTYLDRSDDPEVQPTCVLVAPYDGGGLGIIVIDSTGKFGPVCEQGRKIAETMLSRTPN